MSNLTDKSGNYLKELRLLKEAKLQKIQKAISVEQYFHWVERYWTTRGKPLDFIEHGYLTDIYKDQHHNLVIMKSAQVGLTERMLTEALWLADQFDYNSLYFFPTTASMGDLVQERIDQPINNNAYLREVSGRAKVTLGKHADKVGLKKMSKGFVYFRGSSSLSQITSVPGDAIFVDEVDRMTQENVPYFDKRLEHSDLKWQRWASTPTYTNFGIHSLFIKSDQRNFHVKCNHCNEYQILDHEINIDYENIKIICVKCRKEIIPWKLKGQWVAKYPDNKDVRGYHVSQLYSPKLDLKKFISSYNSVNESEQQQFYNQNLGLPYEPKGDKITGLDIQNCKSDYKAPFHDKKTVFMGVDVGSRLHYVIRDIDNRIVAFGSVKDFFGALDSLESLMKTFPVKGVVIDALPETRKVAEFVNAYKSRVKMCYYSGVVEIKSGQKYWDVNGDKVNTNRTVSLDNMVAEFKRKEVKLPKNLDIDLEFEAHLKAPVRVIKEDSSGIKKANYVETGPDHLFHACNYAKLASNIFNVATPEVFIV